MTDRIARFFESYQRCFGPLSIVVTPKTPADMIDGAPDKSGWVRWRLVPCRADLRAHFADLEKQCNRAFPRSFKQWYSAYFTLDMDTSVVRLPDNPSNAPLRPLREQVLGADPVHRRARELGLLPFGDEAMMDAGPLCFDARPGGDPDTWSVRYWDHEWAHTPQEIGPAIFSRFDALLDGCTAYMDAFAAVKASMPDDPEAWLDHSGECLRALMAADPDGAGGPGREYWESWIDE